MLAENLEVVIRIQECYMLPLVRRNAQVSTKRVSKIVMLATSHSNVAMCDAQCHDSKNLTLRAPA
jgi:hypothetical protein